jgi:integrase
MSVYKRGDTWWYKFWFANKLIRESAKTSSKTLAREAERNRRRDLEKGYNGLATEERSRRVLTFAEAAAPFFANYQLRHPPSSISYMKYCIAHLSEHLNGTMLIEIGVETVKEYQNARLRQKACPKTITEEVMVLLQIMDEMGDLIRVKMKRDKTLKLAYEEFEGIALSADEVKTLYEAAKVVELAEGEKHDLKATRSQMILPAIALALNATLRHSEVTSLTWGRINFLKGILTVGRSKTAAGSGRTIPLNSELREILADYKVWYEEKIGPVAPELYVFPFGKNRHYCPSRPMSTLKTAWENVRAKANLKLRFHDLRHTAITNLCESGASEETILAIAGHVSRKMLRHYAHIRTEAKRKAVEAIMSRKGSMPAAEQGAEKTGS